MLIIIFNYKMFMFLESLIKSEFIPSNQQGSYRIFWKAQHGELRPCFLGIHISQQENLQEATKDIYKNLTFNSVNYLIW